MAVAICKVRCWDGRISRHYYPGDQDDIPLDSPMAKHFDFIEGGVRTEPEKRDFRPTPQDFMMKDPAIEAANTTIKRPTPLAAKLAVEVAKRQKEEKENAELKAKIAELEKSQTEKLQEK